MNESEYIESRQPDYMMPVTETPLTDAAFAEYPVLDTQKGGDAITIQAARKIETSLRAQLAEANEKEQTWHGLADQFKADRDSLHKQLAETEGKLKEAEEQWKFAEEVSGLSSKRIEELLEQNLEIMRQIGCLHDKDRVRTTEHNILVQENRAQAAELLALQAHVEKLRQWVDQIGFTFAGTPHQNIADHALKLLASQPDLTLIEEVREVAEETATIFDDLDTVQWDENGCPVTYQGAQEKIIRLLTRLNSRKD